MTNMMEKMLYMLTQHSTWARKCHPFLLCKCNRADGVKNPDNHVCHQLTHREQIYYFKRSERRWMYKMKKKNASSYTIKNYLD